MIEAMYLDYAQSIPVGITLPKMIERWAEEFTRCHMPAEKVMSFYIKARDRRRRDRDNPSLSSFMPTVDNIIAEWERVYADVARREAEEAQIARERAHAEREIVNVSAPLFEKLAAEAAERRAAREEALRKGVTA